MPSSKRNRKVSSFASRRNRPPAFVLTNNLLFSGSTWVFNCRFQQEISYQPEINSPAGSFANELLSASLKRFREMRKRQFLNLRTPHIGYCSIFFVLSIAT